MCTVELILKGAFIATQVLTSSFFAKGRNVFFIEVVRDRRCNFTVAPLLGLGGLDGWPVVDPSTSVAITRPSRGQDTCALDAGKGAKRSPTHHWE